MNSENNITVNIKKIKPSKFKKFNKKQQALNSIKYDTQKLFALDVSTFSGSKSFVVSENEIIFDKINNGENFFYESIEKDKELAFGLDMDITNLDRESTKDELDKYLTLRLEKIILFFKNKFNKKIELDDFIITKSPYCSKKKKHSFHVKLTGYKFPCPYTVKYYFNQMGLSEEKDGVDSSIYRTGFIRLTFCTKKGQRRPLEPYYIGSVEPQWFYDIKNDLSMKYNFFLKSIWTYVEGYEALDISEYFDMLEEKEEKKKLNEEKSQNNFYEKYNIDTDESIKNSCMYDKDEIRKILNIIDINRFSKELEWKKLLWILRNQSFDCFDIFNDVSSRVDKYDGLEKTKKIWDDAIPNKYPYTIATLKYWAKNDNPSAHDFEEGNLFFDLKNSIEKFEPLKIKQIILDNCSQENKEDLLVFDKNSTIRAILKYLNKFFIKLKNLKGKVVFLEQSGGNAEIRDKRNFLDLLEDCNINFKYEEINPITGKMVLFDYPSAKNKDIHNAGRLWLASPYKKSCQKLTFYPDQNKNFRDTFNMFKGIDLTYEICKNIEYTEDITPMKEHILNIWCKGKKNVYEYTVKLLASYIQWLNVKSGVAIVINGDKGTGKSCIIEKFLKIYGDYGKIVPKLENILGNFNSLLKDVLLVYINEATFTGDKKETNKLRNLITTPSVYVNEKFMPQYTVDNYTNFIIDGNSDQLVCNHGEERRFLLLETDNKWKGVDTKEKQEYFKKILDIQPSTMAKWLYSIDLTDFNPRAIPETDKVNESRVDSLEAHETFFYELIDEGTHVCFREDYPISMLYDEYVECNYSRFRISKNKFSRELNKKMAIQYRKYSRYDGTTTRVVKFKSVEDNKQKFESVFGKLEWSQI